MTKSDSEILPGQMTVEEILKRGANNGESEK